MTTRYILQRAIRTTYTYPRLWALGILLSSGFSVHVWYMAAVAMQYEPVRNTMDSIFPTMPMARVWVIVIVSAIVFLVFNFIKLLFFVQLHGVLHEKPWSDCPLCELQKKEGAQVISRKVYLHTLAVSAIALLITMTFSTVIKMIVLSGWSWSGSMVMIIIVGVIGVMLVSLWNLFSMLGILYTRLSLGRAMIVALDFMSLKASKLFELVIVLTTIFVVCMWFVSMLAYGVLAGGAETYGFSGVSPSLLQLLAALSTIASVVIGVWIMIFQNVFFNMALTIFYLGHTGNLHIEQPLAKATTQL